MPGHARLLSPHGIGGWLVAATLAGVVLAALGPFGSYLNGGWAARAAYWVAAMWLGVPLYGVVLWLRMRAAARWRWPVLVAGVLAVSVPQAALTRLLAMALWPGLQRQAPSLAIWYAQTATIGLVATLGVAWLARRRAPAAHPPLREMDGGALGPPADILALSMEDHYVRVHRAGGTQLVLMPLGRAMAALAGVEGLATHRSWWVARRAVASVEGDARAMRLRLVTGATAPVARSAVARLRAAGWLDQTPSHAKGGASGAAA